MPLPRRALAAATAAALAAPALARAQGGEWPAARPIEVIVPFPPGGGVDTMTRAILPAVQKHLPGARFVVVNRPGAAGQIGWEAAFHAAPDGYTLAATSVPALVTYPIERQTRYRAAEFSFIANVVDDPGGLFVAAASPLRTLADLVAAAKARPGAVSYGSTGVGSDDHLLVIAFEEAAGIRPPMNHVPFNGMAPEAAALLGGHIDVGAFNMSEGLALLRDGKIRGLGQAAARRWAQTSEVPTFREQGFDVISGAQRGFVAPPRLPAAIQARLEDAFAKALSDPDFVREAERLGLPLAPQIGAAYRAEIESAERALRALWQRRPWREG
ncbi:tripartite tricarboxylate transporter substrate binding protein [Caldovatus aquaticus]|uniref:Tripartite tricarboxylate transporter substrate binding protein n=1 Tax=Caldovatus aquaticus TaxID=2865671 RepID=A0ABS7EZE3_9PROT|nr:tripartite tricarboxylate transporter substrate binding protein [Caldovatus aquaticus]MBW8268760.1 tripartite tricarboxylate transporter substrate binding protein [Caldovatus aquaticus]